jgi:7,8-dihydropterin-6-yl-methyl-4-(beta-D-ribofuranosyl)aminobenzene 5'-phosphate synthase
MFIPEIEKISITILMDNSTDLILKNSAHASRIPLIIDDKLNLPPPVAEHGFSVLISITTKDNRQDQYLFDTGVTEYGVIHNADLFGVDFNNINGIILSHGHFDHSAGLINILKGLSSQRRSSLVDIFVHPDAFLRRWLVLSDGRKARMPSLDENLLNSLGATVHKSDDIVLLPKGKNPSLLLTGQIPRTTSFEKGFPNQYAEDPDNIDPSSNNPKLIPDPLVRDDQAIVMNVRNKGLIILTGCGHAGVVNTLNYAKEVTGIDRIYAIMGGFHLPADGGIYEAAMEPTIRELQNADPEYVIPCHCTGWKATNKIIDLMPDRFIQSAVGTTFNF